MSSGGIIDRDAITAAFDVLDAAIDGVGDLSFDALVPRECLALLERCEKMRRRLPVPDHKLINHQARQATPEELGGKLSHAVAEWTLISRAEASRRIPSRASSRPGHARPGGGAPQRTVKNGHILCGFGVPRRNPAVCASGLRELDGVGGLVPRWVPAGWHFIGNLVCARQGVWIPRVLAGHSVGNNGTVGTGDRV